MCFPLTFSSLKMYLCVPKRSMAPLYLRLSPSDPTARRTSASTFFIRENTRAWRCTTVRSVTMLPTRPWSSATIWKKITLILRIQTWPTCMQVKHFSISDWSEKFESWQVQLGVVCLTYCSSFPAPNVREIYLANEEILQGYDLKTRAHIKKGQCIRGSPISCLKAIGASGWFSAISCHMSETFTTAIVEILWWLCWVVSFNQNQYVLNNDKKDIWSHYPKYLP